MIEAGGEPVLPPLDRLKDEDDEDGIDLEGAEELAAALLVVGPSEAGTMGEVPLSWREIEAWARLTMAPFSPGDLEALREMSAEFVAASHEYREKSAPAPYGGVRADPATVSEQLQRGLDALIRANGKRRQRLPKSHSTER